MGFIHSVVKVHKKIVLFFKKTIFFAFYLFKKSNYS